MTSLNEKHDRHTNILTITHPTPSSQPSHISDLPTIEDIDSTHSLSPVHTNKEGEHSSLDREASPFSPFYSHPTTRYSLDAQKSESKQNIAVYEADVEACITPQKTTGATGGLLGGSKTNGNGNGNKECTVWPGQHALKMKKKAMRKNKGCACWGGLSKRARVWIKIGVAVLVVGTAVGVGLGVSKAVGGGVWKGEDNTNAPISSR